MADGSWFDIINAVLSIAGGASSLAQGVKGGNQPQVSSTQVQQQEFPDETRKLIQSTEFPLLAGFAKEQAATSAPFLSGANPSTSPFVQQQYGAAAPALAQAAGKNAGKAGGVSNFGSMDEETAGLAPGLTNALRQLTLSQASKTQSVVPQGYGNFLAPSSFSTSEGKGEPFNPFDTGFKLGSGFSSVAGSLAKG